MKQPMLYIEVMTPKASSAMDSTSISMSVFLTLHVCGRIAKGVQEVFVDDDISKNTLIISIEAMAYQLISSGLYRSLAYTKTVEAAIEIQTVSLSPDPPRYLRGMTIDSRNLWTA
jgi:hypothetical protein